jgi:hypothetical protein
MLLMATTEGVAVAMLKLELFVDVETLVGPADTTDEAVPVTMGAEEDVEAVELAIVGQGTGTMGAMLMPTEFVQPEGRAAGPPATKWMAAHWRCWIRVCRAGQVHLYALTW